jgi:nucleoside-diphosphate-sugar epimerase
LSIRDSFKVFKFCLEKNFFENDIFNALSGNFTVNQILDKIKKIKKKIYVVHVNSPIMNQLSYHVDDKKIKNKGLILKSNIDIDIKNTLLLFKYLKNEM